MKNKSSIILIYLYIISSLIGIFLICDLAFSVLGENTEPSLYEPGAHAYEGDSGLEYFFNVVYQDDDRNEGSVLLHIGDDAVTMRTLDSDPSEGQYYEATLSDAQIDDNTEFRFSADDQNGSIIYFPPLEEDPFLFGDFDGWGEPPVLSEPDVYFDGDDWVFNVTYRDVDGDQTYSLYLVIDDENYIPMSTTDSDPLFGQNYVVRVLETEVNESSEFYFVVDDTGGSYAELHDEDFGSFVVIDFLSSDNGNGGDGDGGDGDSGGSGFQLPSRWSDPEVVVGLIALIAVAGGSAYGVLRRRKKQSRFSELLTDLDEVYGSFKLNPKRCESELEKIKATINEDLKSGVIDENNYTILKNRIDEILAEIRSEAIRSSVSELPKDIELKIKDMLIDGEITRAEYDKILPVIKGSDMTSDDKDKIKNMMESLVKDNKKEG